VQIDLVLAVEGGKEGKSSHNLPNEINRYTVTRNASATYLGEREANMFQITGLMFRRTSCRRVPRSTQSKTACFERTSQQREDKLMIATERAT
jgi:hypothetical protein